MGDNTTCLNAGNVWYDMGHGHSDGCCLCDSNCDHSLETSTDCDYADASAGSCKSDTGVVTCDVKPSACTGTHVYSAPSALDSDGCCFCDESCDHSAETGTDCHKKIYADKAESSGSCYDSTVHVASCDHSMETGTDCSYYDSPGHGDEYTHSPTGAPTPRAVADAATMTTASILAAAVAASLL